MALPQYSPCLLSEVYKKGLNLVIWSCLINILIKPKALAPVLFCDNGLLAYISLTHPIAESAANRLKANQKQFDFNIHFAEKLCLY